MKAIHFSAETGNEMPAHEASREACVVGFCSWKRLKDIFERAGELRGEEVIASFQVDGRGITFRVR